MTLSELGKVMVILVAGDDATDRVIIKTAEGPEHEMALSPSQARALATDLITAVNRAEVKASLKTSPNMWRRTGNTPIRQMETPFPGEPQPRLATAG